MKRQIAVDKASRLLAEIEQHGHRVALDPAGAIVWTAATPTIDRDDPMFGAGVKILRGGLERYRQLAEPIQAELVEVLRSRAGAVAVAV